MSTVCSLGTAGIYRPGRRARVSRVGRGGSGLRYGRHSSRYQCHPVSSGRTPCRGRESLGDVPGLGDTHLSGSKFTEPEVKAEAAELKRPELAAAGRECVLDYGCDVTEYHRAKKAGGTVYNIGQIVGPTAFESQHVTRTMTNGPGLSTLPAFARLLTQEVSGKAGLSEEDQDRIRATAAGIEAETAKVQPDAAKLKRSHELMWKLVEKAGVGLFSPVLIDLGHKAFEALQHLPV